MELLNPLMLWGGLAISIPIILHFWHQKKGKVLAWAATQWLTEKNLQQSRGIRLDNLLLLFLRCLLLLMLAFFLSKPLLNWVNKDNALKKVHLIQANALVIDNFKFELAQATQKGEKLYWIHSPALAVDDVTKLPATHDFNPLILQSSINSIASTTTNEQFNLYLINNQELAKGGSIIIPNLYALHTLKDSMRVTPQSYLEFSTQANVAQKLFVNSSNQLSSASVLDTDRKFEAKPIHQGVIHILLLNQNKAEKQAIEAALQALKDVYQVEVAIDTEVVPEKKYDWVFDDKVVSTLSTNKAFSASTLFIISGSEKIQRYLSGYRKNVIFVPSVFTPQTSDLVFNGALPEWLGEVLVKHYQLQNTQIPLSDQQLHSIFKQSSSSKASEEGLFSKLLLIGFVIILGIERWVAIQKNA